jgi:hypothetical protein
MKTAPPSARMSECLKVMQEGVPGARVREGGAQAGILLTPRLVVSVKEIEEWFQFEAMLLSSAQTQGNGMRRSPMELLEANAGLAGNARFALDVTRHLRLQADVPLNEDWDWAPAVRGVCAGIRAGWRAFNQGTAPTDGLAGVGPGTAPPGPWPLEVLCADAGWEATPRADGRVALRLQTPAGAHTALAGLTPAGGVCARVAAVPLEGRSPEVLRTLALCALTLCSSLRLARAAVAPVEGGPALMLEVGYDYRPAPGEWAQALTSLAAGCHCAVHEWRALQNADLASEYSKRWDWQLAPVPEP